jgi:2-haloacid dehalogenase
MQFKRGIDHFLPEQALIIGDSLTSDIQGGLNAGIPTVWFNPQHQAANLIQPTYEIDNLLQLLPIVMA